VSAGPQRGSRGRQQVRFRRRREPLREHSGIIERVVIDVSGEPYLDLEKEAITMMKRD
jgi:hypothetical protein